MKRPTGLVVTYAALALAATVSAPSASAEGKAQRGCSSPYEQATISEISDFSQSLVDAGFFDEAGLLALLNSIDHNGNGSLCYKLPNGWTGPPATNGAQKDGFVNLVDDKV